MNLMDHVVLLLSCFADIFIVYDFNRGFFQRRNKITKLYMLVISICASIALYMANLIGVAILGLLITPLIIFTYVYIVFDSKLVSKLMYFLLTMIVIIGSEFVFSILVGQTSQDSNINLSTVPFTVIIAKLVTFAILTIIKQVIGDRKKRLTNKYFYMYLLVPVSSIGMMCATLHLCADFVGEIKVKVILLTIFALMFLANILVFLAFRLYSEELYSSMNKEIVIAKEKANRQYYEKISEINEGRKTLIHDMKHYLSGVRGLVSNGENDKALTFLSEVDGKLDANEMIIFSQIPLLDSILTEKKRLAENNNINIDINVDKMITIDEISETDYVAMIGNLLDNALRAANKCVSSKNVQINISEGNNGMLLISKVVNSFDPEQIQLENGKLVTTKKDKEHHGIGLKSVEKMAKECEGMLLLDINEAEFISTLILPKNK